MAAPTPSLRWVLRMQAGKWDRSRSLGVAGLLAAFVLLATPADSPAAGALTQKAGLDGCVSDGGSGGACQNGRSLFKAFSVVTSPDGTNVYAAAQNSSSISIFDRDLGTGALTQKAGSAGCITGQETGGGCTVGRGLSGASAAAVSPDGKSVYVAATSGSALAIFDRDPATGALTQKAGPAGCISETGNGVDCAGVRGLANPAAVSVAPDGTNVYVGGLASNSVAIFDRNTTTGELTQKTGVAGCISEDGSGGECADGVGLGHPASVLVSPDGENAYVASGVSNAIAILDRDPTTGSLAQKAGTAGCISEDGSGGECVDGKALRFANGVAIAPDGSGVYVASGNSQAVAIFDRDPFGGGLTQKSGTGGCISDDGSGGACADGKGLLSPWSVAVSPDGRSAYVGSGGGNDVAVFGRDAATGALTQRTGTAGCVSEDGSGGACADGKALQSPWSVAVSPDAGNVYVASFASNAVAVFDRATLPETMIDAGPASGSVTADPAPAFSFSSDAAPVTFECRTDSGAWTACASPVQLGPLDDGPHTFGVRANDGDGDRDPEPATREFTVDTTGPRASIDRIATAGRRATIDFTSSSPDAEIFECSLDGQPFAACVSPYSAAALTDGRHAFAVRATDRVGNTGAPERRSFDVDTTIAGLDVSAHKKQTQHGDQIKVKLKAGAGERIDVAAGGRIKVKGSGKQVKLQSVHKTVEAGKAKILRLKLQHGRDASGIRKAIDAYDRAPRKRKKHRAVKAAVKVAVSDAAGNRQVESRVVTLK